MAYTDPNREHLFARSHLNAACLICARRERHPIHVVLEWLRWGSSPLEFVRSK